MLFCFFILLKRGIFANVSDCSELLGAGRRMCLSTAKRGEK